MDYTSMLSQYGPVASEAEIAAEVTAARQTAPDRHTPEVYGRCFAALDLTSLNATDSESSIREFVRKAVELNRAFPDLPRVAAVCVYPSFVDVAGLGVGDSGIGVASVAGGFPSSQTYIEVKALEIAMAVENGADEIDVVINVGELLEGQFDRMAGELSMLREEAGEETLLKVIIESGALRTPDDIRRASLLAMLAGADFIKTSTGKIPAAATPEAAVVMCTAIRDYYRQTGRRVGFKVAGGIRTAEDAALYYTIVERILGPEWLAPRYFRIGASALAGSLLNALVGRQTNYF